MRILQPLVPLAITVKIHFNRTRLMTRKALLCAAQILFLTFAAAILAAAADNQSGASAGTSQEVNQLKIQLADQQRQIEELRTALQKLIADRKTGTSEDATPPASVPAAVPGLPQLGQVASTTPIVPVAPAVSAPLALPTPATTAAPQQAMVAESPLQLHIGSATITPVGFMDFTAVLRTTNPGSGIGTNFGSIPYNTGVTGNIGEFRLSAQNSRVGLRVDANVHGANVLGYMESDFLGANPANVAVTSNSNSMRLRLYWVDVRKDMFEVLAGQSWSMLTPNRRGLSALPGDLFYSQDMDVNYQNGLTWSRQPQIRFIVHPNDKVAM